MAKLTVEEEKIFLLGVTAITLKNLCDLLIDKGVITKDEYKKITDDANDSLQKAFTEE